MTTLTKTELTNLISDQLGLNKAESAGLVNQTFAEIALTLTNGELVKIAGFGNFHLSSKSSRLGRNPKTGEEKVIAPRRVVAFHSSNKMKSTVAQSTTKIAAAKIK